MNAKQALKNSFAFNDRVAYAYLDDLKEEELLVRPVPGANHIAWQLGHLIASENQIVESMAPGSMPALPAGWADKYTKETSKLDDPRAFHSKAEYLRLMKEQRAGTLAVLERQSEADFDKPSPPGWKMFKTVGDVFVLLSNHTLMHAGQWAVVRRKLGRPPLM